MAIGKLMMAVFLFGLAANAARAEMISIGLSAQVSYIDDREELLDGLIDIGDTVTGSYTYDSDKLDNSLDERVGAYWHYGGPYGIVLNVGEYVFQTDPENVEFLLGLYDNYIPDTEDNYLLRSYKNLALSNGVPVLHISWQLDDYSGTALSSDALPLGPPVLQDWDYNRGLRIELGPKGETRITADVTSVWLIPEPATVLLLGLGALALLGIRRRG